MKIIILQKNIQIHSDMKKRELTESEKRVIINKGTEMPFSGEYWNNTRRGTYVCRQCGAPLYRSEDKFDAGCGWPSFDDEIPGAVLRQPDADGRRTEIVCASCGGHLGHVFTGERLTPKNTRHCVNSISMRFIPADENGNAHERDKNTEYETAYFAGGCFWGVEYYMASAPGVVSAESGYMGGRTDSPTYEQVCSGRTGHAETVKVVYDPKVTSFEQLCKLFFEIHDPTQENRQGPDIGEQYRSEIFYTSPEQKEIAERLIDRLVVNGYDVATRLTPATVFWPAEDYHQRYYSQKGTTPYCHRRVNRF